MLSLSLIFMNCIFSKNEWIVEIISSKLYMYVLEEKIGGKTEGKVKAKAHSLLHFLLDPISSACKQYVQHSCSSWNWD